MNNGVVKELELTDEVLQEIVRTLGGSVKPRVVYRPDPHQMTEEALDICQKNARTVLKLLRAALPANHWLAVEIGDLLDWVQIITFLVFLTFYIPCVSTFAVMLKTIGKKEAFFSILLSVTVFSAFCKREMIHRSARDRATSPPF